MAAAGGFVGLLRREDKVGWIGVEVWCWNRTGSMMTDDVPEDTAGDQSSSGSDLSDLTSRDKNFPKNVLVAFGSSTQLDSFARAIGTEVNSTSFAGTNSQGANPRFFASGSTTTYPKAWILDPCYHLMHATPVSSQGGGGIGS